MTELQGAGPEAPPLIPAMSRRKYTLKDLPEEERPRERLYKYGPQALKTSELLAILIRTGSEEETALQLAERLLKKYDGNLRRLAQENETRLAEGIKGLGPSKSAQILAAFELGRRLAAYTEDEKVQIKSASDVARLMMPWMRDLVKETLYVLCLDTKNYLIKYRRIFEGSLNASVIHPREIFRFALEESAASIILVHNHPSGDPAPSADDISSTRQIVQAGKILDIPVLDHVIIGDGTFVSMKERGLI